MISTNNDATTESQLDESSKYLDSDVPVITSTYYKQHMSTTKGWKDPVVYIIAANSILFNQKTLSVP